MIKAYNKHSIHLLGQHVCSVTFFWLKRIPIHQLTQSLCYNIPFHLYIHDQGLQQTFTTLPCRVNMYETPLYEQLYFTYSVTFFGSNEYQFN